MRWHARLEVVTKFQWTYRQHLHHTTGHSLVVVDFRPTLCFYVAREELQRKRSCGVAIGVMKAQAEMGHVHFCVTRWGLLCHFLSVLLSHCDFSHVCLCLSVCLSVYESYYGASVSYV